VGLKPTIQATTGRTLNSSLNRTSVGLKLDEAMAIIKQRDEASIEPAWD